jgi:hypothetical protein
MFKLLLRLVYSIISIYKSDSVTMNMSHDIIIPVTYKGLRPNSLKSQLNSQFKSQLNSQFKQQLNSQFKSQLNSQFKQQLNSQFKQQLNSSGAIFTIDTYYNTDNRIDTYNNANNIQYGTILYKKAKYYHNDMNNTMNNSMNNDAMYNDINDDTHNDTHNAIQYTNYNIQYTLYENASSIFSKIANKFAKVSNPIVSPVHYVTNSKWDNTIHELNFCINKDVKYENGDGNRNDDTIVYMPLITTAINIINKYLLVDNNKSLYINLQNSTCDYIIYIKNDINEKHPGFCKSISNNQSIYRGCNITLNICHLQTAASFYNVLLHELLHVIGLLHPVIFKGSSVMSYVTLINNDGSDIFNNKYIELSRADILDIYYIINRDYPNSNFNKYRIIQNYVPLYPPYKHVSGTNNFKINYKNSIAPCWLLL